MAGPALQRRSKGRRWRRPALAVLVGGGALWITIASIWNILRLSFPLPAPASTISAREHQRVAGPAPSTAGIEPETAPAWTRELGAPVAAPLAVDSERVYVVAGHTSQTARVEALDVHTGERLWSLPLNSVTDYSPTVADGFLYIGTRAGRLIAVDGTSGGIKWEVRTGASVTGPPHVRDGVLYAGSSQVMAFDAASGKPRWRHDVGSGVAWPIAVDRDVVALLAADSHFYLASAKNGKRRLSFPLWFSPAAGPVISGRTVAFAGSQGRVQAMDLEGSDVPFEKMIRWWRTRLYLWDVIKSPPPVPRGYLWQRRDLGGMSARALVGDGQATYFAVDAQSGTGRLVALANDSGHTKWEVVFDSRIGASATFVGDHMLVGGESGHVYAVDSASGQVKWQLNFERPVVGSPALVGALMIVASTDGHISAFETAPTR